MQPVLPSVSNPSDPNYYTEYDYFEFTLNDQGVWADISYIDFVQIPIGLELINADKTPGPAVAGLDHDGLAAVATALKNAGGDWAKLVGDAATKAGQQPMSNTSLGPRVLGPGQAIVNNRLPGIFSGYFDKYIDDAWNFIKANKIVCNTTSGDFTGFINDANQLEFDNSQFARILFNKPTSTDLLTCSTGPFVVDGPPQKALLIPILCAAFNRSTIVQPGSQPNGVPENKYYIPIGTSGPAVNEYSSICKSHTFSLTQHGH